ncbi:MAG: hypothetical protein JW864_15015 [Spirochaetes bacterium]|nr:hypothetical protein [Spirochaetota bacterium]
MGNTDPADGAVQIAEANLEASIRENHSAQIPDAQAIIIYDMESLTVLYAENDGPPEDQKIAIFQALNTALINNTGLESGDDVALTDNEPADPGAD